MQVEEWRDIPNFDKYQVSNLGNVRSLKNYNSTNQRLLTKKKDNHGYELVGFYNDKKIHTKKVHQLVCICFLNHDPKRTGLVVNHKDFNRTNNNLINLEVITQRENSNKKHLKSSSQYVGVSWSKKYQKWSSYFTYKSKIKHLGYFLNEIDAQNSRVKYEQQFIELLKNHK